MESILITIKKLLGMTEEYEAFDTDVITHINSAFFTLYQLGVGPQEPFSISGDQEQWTDFSPNISKLESVKSYVYMKVRLIFDPPQSGQVLQSYERQIQELEWRLLDINDEI